MRPLAKGKYTYLTARAKWSRGSPDDRLVHILAAGVFFTGFVKDFFSLPRPLSPPLHRITMSGSAALEYGFPSTHSANAVSVAVYGMLMLHSPDNTLQPNTKFALEALAYCYTVSIIFGRLYCGMHGFLDVIIGSTMGAVISLIEFYYGPLIELYLREQAVTGVLILSLIIIVLVRVHPEPADDCPCFDDSVAFAGVVIGVEIGSWHFTNSPYALFPFSLDALGWVTVIVRILLGVFCVVAWREVAKPVLLKTLPFLFRLIETWGLALPRRFFMPASEYKNIPLRLRTDNMVPRVSEIPKIVNNIRKGGRGRSISIGPQSAADAYETLAYRERRRRESIGSNGSLKSRSSIADLKAGSPYPETNDEQAGRSSAVSGGLKLSDYERLMGEGTVLVSPSEDKIDEDPMLAVGHHDELDEQEVFALLVKPRVRYDVEVVTKLVVYGGKYLRSFLSSFQVAQLVRLCRLATNLRWRCGCTGCMSRGDVEILRLCPWQIYACMLTRNSQVSDWLRLISYLSCLNSSAWVLAAFNKARVKILSLGKSSTCLHTQYIID